MNKAIPPTLSRRRVLSGVATTGALAAAAVGVPLARQPDAPPTSAKVSDSDGRYQVTQHVLRYYETAKV